MIDAKATDPIFEAIERHKVTRARFETACGRVDEVEAREAGRQITQADREAHDAASDDEVAALTDLALTAPTTIAGLAAGLSYISQFNHELVQIDKGSADTDNCVAVFAMTVAGSSLITEMGAVACAATSPRRSLPKAFMIITLLRGARFMFMLGRMTHKETGLHMILARRFVDAAEFVHSWRQR